MTKVVDESSRGSSIDAQVDETILVRLKETPTSGYRWAVDQIDPGILGLEGTTFEQPADAAIGAAGERTFAVKAKSPGTGQIALKLWRDWEGPSSVVGTFNLAVNVK